MDTRNHILANLNANNERTYNKKKTFSLARYDWTGGGFRVGHHQL
jgi:hypothetical protein